MLKRAPRWASNEPGAALDAILQALRVHPALAVVWVTGVGLSAGYLAALSVACIVRRDLAMRFLGGFASSWRANGLEAVLRLAAGLSFMGASPDLKASIAFFTFGAFLAVSAVVIGVAWRLHRRYARWAIPFAQRILPLYAALSAAFGGLIVWALV
jgi:hypothetical protein